MISILQEVAAWIRLRGAAESDRGASIIEYALLVAFIAVLCVLAVDLLGQETLSGLDSTGSGLSSTN